MSTWLDPVRAALEAATRPVRVFCRDDDAGWDDDALWLLIDRVALSGFTVDVAAIPGSLGDATVRGLRHRIDTGVARVHQHGFAHVDHQVEGRKCEFGADRAVADQRGDLARGRARLLDAFGGDLEPVFTPPWNRCTMATGEALRELGVRVLSREWRAAPLGVADLVEVPVTLDWTAHRKGVPLDRSAWALELADQVRAGGPVGLMFHHATLDAEDRELIGLTLAVLRASPNVEATSIVGVAGIHADATVPRR